MRTLDQAAEFGCTCTMYRVLREHDGLRAITALRYIRSGTYLTPEQFACETERGHTWSYTGSAYGGDDESHHGEGVVHCSNCGADGDA